MTQKDNIRNELLKQMDKDSGKNFDTTDSIREIFAKDKTRIKRMKWLMIFTWVVVVILFIVAGVIEHKIKGLGGRIASPQHTMWLNITIWIIKILFLLAVVFSISFYSRLRTLTMKQIQVRLSEIEKAIKKSSPNDKSNT
jgi:hypothetical protein